MQSQVKGLTTPPLLFPAMSREEGSEERSESYLAS